MYGFGIVVLLGLLVGNLVDFVARAAGGRLPAWGTNLIAAAAGVGALEALQFSLFEEWGLSITADWVGVVFTGLIVYGVSAVGHGVYGVLSGIAKRTKADVVPIERPRAAA